MSAVLAYIASRNVAAEIDMHERLIAYGRIILRGRTGANPCVDSEDLPERYEFTGQEADEAYLLHARVIMLPEVRQRFVIQVFYRDGAAARWDHLSPTYKATIISAMADDVNAGLRKYNSAVAERVRSINWRDFEGIRARAIQILVNSWNISARQLLNGGCHVAD